MQGTEPQQDISNNTENAWHRLQEGRWHTLGMLRVPTMRPVRCSRAVPGTHSAHTLWHQAPSCVRRSAPPRAGHSTQGGGSGRPDTTYNLVGLAPQHRQANVWQTGS